MAGKGSRMRPLGVSKSQFDENWERIFNKKDVAISEDLSDNDLQELANQIADAETVIDDLAVQFKNKG